MSVDPCRFGMMCWRPLCPFGHACTWAATWAFFAAQKDEEDGEDTVDLVEEVLEVIKDSPVHSGAHHGADR